MRFVRFSEYILHITKAKCFGYIQNFTYNQSVLQLIPNFINKHGAGIAQSVRDYTIERTAARHTQKEVLHSLQTGCGPGQLQIQWVPMALPTRLQRPGSEVPGLGMRGAIPSLLHTSVIYEFGSFWTSVPIHQTTRFHIQEVHNFNTQWRHKHKPQHPSSIISRHVSHFLSHISGMNAALSTLLRTGQFSTKVQLLYPVYAKGEP